MAGRPTFALRLGNQTSFSAASPLVPFEFALANGFTAFEFFPDRGPSGAGGWDEGQLDGAARRYIRESALTRDVALSVHAPLEYNPLCDPESERLAGAVRFGADIGARVFNLHLESSVGPEAFLEALAPTLRAVSAAGMLLVLENTVTSGPEAFNRFFALLRERAGTAADRVGMCFDLGHANLCAPTRNDYLGFVDALSKQVPIRHLHLHENFGDSDSHLVLFTGPARQEPGGLRGLLERLQRRRFNGCGIFEQWPQPPDALVQARDRLMGLLAHPAFSRLET